MAASEAVPWSKTGGLADVATSLAKALASFGHDVTLVIPYHRGTSYASANADAVHNAGVELSVPVGDRTAAAQVCWADVPGSTLRVLLIDQPDFFDRPGLYHDSSGDYDDNLDRFTFFSRAVLEVASKLVLRPNIVHANDWQTGLIPALLEIERHGTPGFERTKSVFTVHNLAFQGWFPSRGMEVANLGWEYFNWRQMECHDQLNLLKTGLAFADQLTTVSPTYAEEIQTPEFGCGLHDLLTARQADLVGVLNGIDSQEWSPSCDPLIPCRYGVDDYRSGKSKCKANLQETMGLPTRPDTPLFGMVTRLTDQKGLDLVTELASRLMREDIQIAFLGSGDERYEWMLSELASRFPEKVVAKIGFDERLAHQIEAAADFYLMPSRFEPCGLNQIYSLAYGTIPLVRKVGGLADSVVDVTSATLEEGTATGIVFEAYNSDALVHAFYRCLELFRNPQLLDQVIKTAMKQDFSWCRSAKVYESVYQKSLTEAFESPTSPGRTGSPHHSRA